MKKTLNILLVAVLLWPGLAGMVHLPERMMVCSSSNIFLPIMVKAETKMQKSAVEQLEKILKQKEDFPYDGRIVEIFPESVNVRRVGSRTIERGVVLPDHIKYENLAKGMAVKLNDYRGKPMVMSVLPQFDQDRDYAGKGTVFPNPPQPSVLATSQGWLVTWNPVVGANRYRVYKNDTADGTSPVEVGYITQTSITVPYESPYIYFAIRSVSGINESEMSGWVTDSTPPEIPDSFSPENYIDSHKLNISGDDVSLTDPGFMCWEIETAIDSNGTDAASLGYFYPIDFPVFIALGPGTLRYYRIRAIDFAGNASEWTSWDDAWVLEGVIKDLFDGYGGDYLSELDNLWWLGINQFEDASEWDIGLGGAGSTSRADNDTVGEFSEGRQGVKISVTDAGSVTKSVAWDLSNEGRFTNDDYIVIRYTAHHTLSDFRLRLYSSGMANYFCSPSLPGSIGNHYEIIKKSDFSVGSGTPDWSDIIEAEIYFTGSGVTQATVDDLRIIKADPDNSDTYNDTGPAWDRSANTGTDVGEWHIYSGNRAGEPSKPYSYGQIKTATSSSVWYLSHKPLTTTNVMTGTVQAGIYLKNNDGAAGLSFFIKDVEADSWDMYVVEADSAADTITLAKYVAGVRTQIAQASFTFAPGQIFWLGADLRDYQADEGRLRVYASLNEGNLIQASNMILSEQDSQWLTDAGGSVGLLSYQCNNRFVNFVAGSPAHASVADEALSLIGPILGALVLSEGGELTIDTGEITVGGHSIYTVDTESDASSDDLDTINGGVPNQFLILQAADNTRTVICKDGTGNLRLEGDCSLDNGEDTITMVKRGSTWCELCRSNNAA